MVLLISTVALVATPIVVAGAVAETAIVSTAAQLVPRSQAQVPQEVLLALLRQSSRRVHSQPKSVRPQQQRVVAWQVLLPLVLLLRDRLDGLFLVPM
jgi:hypothetical protein